MRMRAWEGVLAGRPYACALTTVSMTAGVTARQRKTQRWDTHIYFMNSYFECAVLVFFLIKSENSLMHGLFH